MLMRNTSAPASNSRAIMAGVGGGRAERGDDLGAAQASHRLLAFGWQLRRRLAAGGVRQHRRARRAAALLRRLLGGVGELHRPGALLAGVDLEEAGAVDSRAPGNPRCRGW